MWPRRIDMLSASSGVYAKTDPRRTAGQKLATTYRELIDTRHRERKDKPKISGTTYEVPMISMWVNTHTKESTHQRVARSARDHKAETLPYLDSAGQSDAEENKHKWRVKICHTTTQQNKEQIPLKCELQSLQMPHQILVQRKDSDFDCIQRWHWMLSIRMRNLKVLEYMFGEQGREHCST